jgi:hypothetical protein
MTTQYNSKTAAEQKVYKSHLGGTFSGSRENLVAVLNPHVANWLKIKTGTTKKALERLKELKCYNPHCPDRSGDTSFDTAHPIDKSRPEVIREAIAALHPIGEDDTTMLIKDCNIAAVLAKVKEIHLEMPITFLCNACNHNHANLSLEGIVSKKLTEWIPKKSKSSKSEVRADGPKRA